MVTPVLTLPGEYFPGSGTVPRDEEAELLALTFTPRATTKAVPMGEEDLLAEPMEGVENALPSYEEMVQEEAGPTTPGACGRPGTSEPQSRTEPDSPIPEAPAFEVEPIVQLSSDDEEGPRVTLPATKDPLRVHINRMPKAKLSLQLAPIPKRLDRDDKYAATSEENLLTTMEKDPTDRVDQREASLHRRWMNEMQKRNEGTAERKRGGWPTNYGPGDEAYCLHCNRRINASLCFTTEECTCQESKREPGKIGPVVVFAKKRLARHLGLRLCTLHWFTVDLTMMRAQTRLFNHVAQKTFHVMRGSHPSLQALAVLEGDTHGRSQDEGAFEVRGSGQGGRGRSSGPEHYRPHQCMGPATRLAELAPGVLREPPPATRGVASVTQPD